MDGAYMPTEVLNLTGVALSGITALGGLAAVFIALRTMVISRQSAAVERLFDAFGDIISSLQEVSRLGQSIDKSGDIHESRTIVGDSFYRFTSARARADLALDALARHNNYLNELFDVSHNFAADILQADEFSGYANEFALSDVEDRSWVEELSWLPSGPDAVVLARSSGFFSARGALDLVTDDRLKGIDRWWGEKILEDYSSEIGAMSVYSLHASYMTQHSRLLDDFVREYLQPALSEEVRAIVKIYR